MQEILAIVSDINVRKRTTEPRLGFCQARRAVIKTLWRAVKVPLGVPAASGGETPGGNHEVCKGRFFGLFNCHNMAPSKVDCLGLDMSNTMKEIV
jgi:hypothetical protein